MGERLLRRLAAGLCAGTMVVLAACAGGGARNPETFDVKSGREVVRYVLFEEGRRAELWVSSEKDSDVDLFVYDDGDAEVAKDVGAGRDCHVAFTADRTQIYKVVVRNRVCPEPHLKGRNVDNKCTLKWRQTS
jgi:hypothetical protein